MDTGSRHASSGQVFGTVGFFEISITPESNDTDLDLYENAQHNIVRIETAINRALEDSELPFLRVRNINLRRGSLEILVVLGFVAMGYQLIGGYASFEDSISRIGRRIENALRRLRGAIPRNADISPPRWNSGPDAPKPPLVMGSTATPSNNQFSGVILYLMIVNGVVVVSLLAALITFMAIVVA